MDIQKVSSSFKSHSHEEMKYDVFLSFRGVDTRKSFTGHLHHALGQKGVYCFMDDKELERGEPISPVILDAIEKSKISIVVLSRNYASSASCLEELVKALECRTSKGQVVLPIFYDVDPSEVRSEKGRFGDAIRRLQEQKYFTDEAHRLQKWKASLQEVSNLSGWKLGDRYESKFIQKIVTEVLSKLKRTTLNVAKNPVGLDSQVHDMLSLLSTELKDVRMVGICGIGGVGKTTLAKAVYNSIMDQFDCSSFVANVREFSRQKSGPVQLQESMLSQIFAGSKKYSKVNHVDEGVNILSERLCHRKVLIVLDDVDKLDQLENLAGDCSWFGYGSIIIITTRDEHLLVAHGVEIIYKVKELDPNCSLELFSLNAFKKPFPKKEFEDLSFHVLNYAKGLPLALIVLGSFLCSRNIQVWKSTLTKLKRVPDKQIYDTLKISFDGLEDHEKAIFLDIACFFKGVEKDYVVKILDSCNFYAESGVSVLVDKSLVTIESNEIWMHDLIQEMGWEIVRQESTNEPGKRSRLWFHEDALRVLTGNTGTEVIEGIKLDLPESEVVSLDPKTFTNMKNLRLLIVRNAKISGSHLEFLSNELRLLDWPGYPFLSLPSSFGPNKLVAMELSYSHIKHLMLGFKVYKNLKLVNLSFSEFLEEIPDFSIIPNLESLVLDHCTSLVKVHSSIGALDKLVTLSLIQCFNLKSLPSLKLKSLQYLYLVGCSKLKNFPNIIEKMERLEQIYLEGTALKELPSSIENLVGLKFLYLDTCKNLEGLPSNIHKLQNLVHLGLNGCSKLCKVQELPPNLAYFSVADCQSLEIIPKFNSYDLARCPYYCLNLTNCKKLAKYQVDYLANMLNTTEVWIDAEIIYPGSNIPEWLSLHNTVGSSTISFEVPSNLYAKPLAWCFYVMFGPKEGTVEAISWFSCSVEIVINDETRIATKKLFQSVESDHVWLKSYLPIPFRWRWNNNKMLWTRFDVSFAIRGVPTEEAHTQAVLKKCGFHLLYEQDGHMTIPMMVKKTNASIVKSMNN